MSAERIILMPVTIKDWKIWNKSPKKIKKSMIELTPKKPCTLIDSLINRMNQVVLFLEDFQFQSSANARIHLKVLEWTPNKNSGKRKSWHQRKKIIWKYNLKMSKRLIMTKSRSSVTYSLSKKETQLIYTKELEEILLLIESKHNSQR